MFFPSELTSRVKHSISRGQSGNPTNEITRSVPLWSKSSRSNWSLIKLIRFSMIIRSKKLRSPLFLISRRMDRGASKNCSVVLVRSNSQFFTLSILSLLQGIPSRVRSSWVTSNSAKRWVLVNLAMSICVSTKRQVWSSFWKRYSNQ